MQMVGSYFNSVKVTLKLKSGKRQEMKELIGKICNLQRCKMREFVRLISCIISCCVAMEFGLLYFYIAPKKITEADAESRALHTILMRLFSGLASLRLAFSLSDQTS